MALVLPDRVKVSSVSTGTGDFTVNTPISGFETFESVGDGNTTYYVIQHDDVNEWEVGIGTYTSTGTLLSRDTILQSSNSDSAVNFSSGSKTVFVTLPSAKIVYKDTAGTVNLESLDITNYIDLSNSSDPSYSEGRIYYDNTEKTLAYYNDVSSTSHQIGVEEHVRVYNNTGSTIAKGKPVYWSGNFNGYPTVALGNATDVNKYNTQGLATHDIPNATYGYICVSGIVGGFDTSGLAAGQNFFLGLTDGAVQNESPTYPNFPMCLGWVIVSDASDGKLLVNQQNHSVNSFRVRTSAHIGQDLIVDGDLTIVGSQTVSSTNNVETGAAFNYLNAGDTIGEANTTFTGTGLDDAFFSGHFSGTASTTYYVKIDGTGTPDTFAWSKDNFVTTEASAVAITGAAQTLDNGIKIDFGATTGHTLNDVWSGTAAPTNIDTGIWSNRNTGTSGVGYTHIGWYFDVSDEKFKFVEEYDPEPEGTINSSDASFSLATVAAATFEGALSGNVTGNVIGNVTGNLTGNVTGNADTATSAATLTTARTIGGVSFDGSANIDLPGVNTTGNQATTGNAATATALQTARDISLGGDLTGSASFDGTANITITAAITGFNNTNWDTAFSWGNHASAGYLLSSSYTAADVLTKLLTVDGASSLLDSDLLDGQQGSYYLDYDNFTNTPPGSEVTTTAPTAGDASGKPNGYVWYVV